MNHSSGASADVFEEDLNLYLDGELPSERQELLFEHLAACSACRARMDSVMEFRRLSRQEFISVSPAVDDSFLERLARLKKSNDRFDRQEDRRPLWNARQTVSVGTAVLAITAVFVIGLMLPMTGDTHTAEPIVQVVEERVQFEDAPSEVRESPIYVFVPGLTIEADRLEDSPSGTF
ncbi:MAG: hypothetical protein HKN17_03890 [Rhodothermales bacterium]|nr:hypothetical protein [Rhodothermales bacterium]